MNFRLQMLNLFEDDTGGLVSNPNPTDFQNDINVGFERMNE
jgi:hypothetical protein